MSARSFRLPLTGALLLALTACDPSTVTTVTSIPPGAQTVVIVPSVPESLIVATRGVTIFGNNLDQPSIADWHLADLIYSSAKQALEPRYQVSEAIPNQQLIDTQSRLNAALDHDDGVAQALSQLVHISPAPDLYVVFCVSARSHPYVDTPTTPYFMQDIGVSNQLAPFGLPSLVPTVTVHTYLEVTVIDGKSMKVLGDTPLLMPPDSNIIHGPLMSRNDPMPERGLKDFDWHDNWADMTHDEQTLIRATIEDLLQKSVPYTVTTALNAN